MWHLQVPNSRPDAGKSLKVFSSRQVARYYLIKAGRSEAAQYVTSGITIRRKARRPQRLGCHFAAPWSAPAHNE